MHGILCIFNRHSAHLINNKITIVVVCAAISEMPKCQWNNNIDSASTVCCCYNIILLSVCPRSKNLLFMTHNQAHEYGWTGDNLSRIILDDLSIELG